MDGIKINPVAIPTLPQAKSSQAHVLPRPSSESAPEIRQPDFDAAAAEHRRFEAVQRAARNVANLFVVSDRRFTIFKDSSGQYITRFTSLRDGQVTYIPEPELLRQGGNSVAIQTLSINV